MSKEAEEIRKRKEISEPYSGFSVEQHTTNYGEVVACDFCNEGEESTGGVLIGSYAVCGDCSEKNGYYNETYEYKNEITEHFNTEQTFRENVLEYRKKSYGTRDAIQTIMSW